jgi:1-phosphofructokinase family hexose kinase
LSDLRKVVGDVILIVSLNPALDYTVFGEAFRVWETNRGVMAPPEPGGKGCNTARVSAALGSRVMVTGLLGGISGEFIRAKLESENIAVNCLPIPSHTRFTVSFIDRKICRETKIVPDSPPLPAGTAEDFCSQFAGLLRAHSFSMAALCGSLPGDLPPDFYARLIEIGALSGVPVAVDTSGPALYEAVKGAPYLICPNLEEASGLLGKKDEDLLIREMRNLTGEINLVALTLGEKGAVFIYRDRLVRVRVEHTYCINPVGAGDSFLGGFLAAYDQCGPESDELFRWPVAAGASTAQSAGLLWEGNRFQDNLNNLVVEEVAG